MSNYQSLRKAGFSDKQLRKMGITPQFPENPKFDSEGDLSELTGLELGITNKYTAFVVVTMLHRVLKFNGLPMDTPVTIYECKDGAVNQHGQPAESNYTNPDEMAELLKDQKNAQSGIFRHNRHYVSFVNRSDMPGYMALFFLGHELTHLCQYLKGDQSFKDHKGTAHFVPLSGEYENQFAEKQANVNGLKYLKALCRMFNLKYDSVWWNDSMEWFLDPTNKKTQSKVQLEIVKA